MYLHFIIDSVYSQRFIEENDKVSNDNVYVLLGNDANIKYLDKEKIIVINLPIKKNKIDYLFEYFNKIILVKKMIKKADRVYFHFLQFFHCLVLSSTIKKICSYWLIWGADIYNRIEYELFDNKTKSVIDIRKFHKGIKYRIGKKIEHIGIKKITYVGTIIKGDYQLLVDNYGIKNNRIDFFYSNPLKFDSFEHINRNKDKKTRVIIGNSGDPTNNHLSVIDSLKDYSNIEVFCPLSYGDEKYIKFVKEYGKKVLGDRFIPIIDFMKQEEYLTLLDSIDIGIFNHYRQQALGNIFALLVLGKKVFVNNKSPVYTFLIENEIKIENTEDLLLGKQIDFHPLNEKEKENNINEIMLLHSEKKSLEYIKGLYI